jgi:hypothetical protein
MIMKRLLPESAKNSPKTVKQNFRLHFPNLDDGKVVIQTSDFFPNHNRPELQKSLGTLLSPALSLRFPAFSRNGIVPPREYNG